MERAIIKRVRAALAARGAWSMKVHGSVYQPRGTPDIIGCARGRMFAFEVKQHPAEEPDDLQKYTLGLIRAAGGVATTVSSAAEAIDALQDAGVFDGTSEVGRVDTGSA